MSRSGRLDLAVANHRSHDLSIVRWASPTGFRPAETIPSGAQGPSSVAAADFDADGRVDLAIANFDDGDISLLRGGAAGALAAPVSLLSGLVHPVAVLAAKLDGDDRPDLVILEESTGLVVVLLARGSGFERAEDVDSGNDPFAVTAGDFNSDGTTDLAVVNASSADVALLLGDGAGGFRPGGTPRQPWWRRQLRTLNCLNTSSTSPSNRSTLLRQDARCRG
jgi:hypothetical protein